MNPLLDWIMLVLSIHNIPANQTTLWNNNKDCWCVWICCALPVNSYMPHNSITDPTFPTSTPAMLILSIPVETKHYKTTITTADAWPLFMCCTLLVNFCIVMHDVVKIVWPSLINPLLAHVPMNRLLTKEHYLSQQQKMLCNWQIIDCCTLYNM